MRDIIDEKLQSIYEKGLRNMIESAFAYGNMNKESHTYDRYILPYKQKLGEETFERIYDEHTKYLTENFEVVHGTYTDSEGVTYNSLKQK